MSLDRLPSPPIASRPLGVPVVGPHFELISSADTSGRNSYIDSRSAELPGTLLKATARSHVCDSATDGLERQILSAGYLSAGRRPGEQEFFQQPVVTIGRQRPNQSRFLKSLQIAEDTGLATVTTARDLRLIQFQIVAQPQ